MNFQQFEEAVSKERLDNCTLKVRNHDKILVPLTKSDLIKLYVFNEVISKELRFALSQYEVCLRNKLDKNIQGIRGQKWILSLNTFLEKEQKRIVSAQEQITEDEKEITHHRVIAKMTLGFWTRFFTKDYDSWIRPDIFSLFPNNNLKRGASKTMSRTDINKVVHHLVKLRNKVSHNEFILSPKYRIKESYFNCLLLMFYMDKEFYHPFQKHEFFLDKYAEFEIFIEEIKRREVRENSETTDLANTK